MSNIVWLKDKDAVFVKAKVVKDYSYGRRKSVVSILAKSPNLFGKVSLLTDPSIEIEVSKDEVYPYNFTHDKPEPDLASVNDLNEPAVLNVVRERLSLGSIYTKIEPLVISVNPYKHIPLLYDINRYHTLPYDQREAHVYCIARNALHRVPSINQSIAVSGESGAGKTEACKLLISYLTTTAKGAYHSLNGDGLDVKIMACNPILEAFGNASTLRNDNSSRFGKYLRLKVQHGSLVGAELVHYLLEKGRVISQHSHERTFHIFHQLFAGAGPSMLSGLLLDPNGSYQYLGEIGVKAKEKPNDSHDFFDLIKALSDIGMGLKTQNDIFRLIATILHLGNFEFEYEHSMDATSAVCHLKPSKYVEFVSKAIGIPVDNLGPALTTRTVQSSGRSSFYSVPLTADQAKGNTAALAKELYNRLFSWLIYSCNMRMCPPPTLDPRALSYIGILDIFGFEVFDENRFEQMCINFCNEKIQAMFNTRIFEAEIAKLVEEGIPVDGIKYESCSECLSLLEGDSGIFKLTDEFCFLNKPVNEDLPLLDLIDKHHRDINSRYIARNTKLAAKYPGMREDTFIVKHFAGDAVYTIAGFISSNGDRLENDLLDMIKSGESELIQQFYEVQAITNTENAPVEEGKTPMKKRRHSIKKITISAKFRTNLRSLIVELESTSTQFLRCIKPNQNKSPVEFDAALVYSQLCYSGVIGVVAIRKCSFPLRQSWAHIHDRLMTLKLYKGVSEISLSGERNWDDEKKESAAKKLLALAFPNNASGDYYQGKSIVYMKQDIYEKISAFFSTKSVICIQQRIRGVLTRSRIRKLRDAIIKVQRLWWQKKYREKKMSAVIKCQSFFRMCRCKMMVGLLRRIREVAYLLNRWRTRARIRKRRYATLIRLFLLRPTWRLPISRMPGAHRTLTDWFRAKLHRMYFLKARAAVTRITAWYRGRKCFYVFRVEIKYLRVILRKRLEKQSVCKLIRFLRATCYRNYCRALFSNIKAGLTNVVKMLLRRIRKANHNGSQVDSIGVGAGLGTGVPLQQQQPATPKTGLIRRQLSRSNSIFDMGGAMPINYQAFMPVVNEDGELEAGPAASMTSIRFGRSSILKDVNINNIRDSSEGFATLLHTAANYGWDDIVTLLLEAGADPMATDSVHFTPLHRVMRLGKVGYPTVDVLLTYAKDLAGIRDLYGRTARDIAEEKSTKFDAVEIGMIATLVTSEQCHSSKQQLVERKQRHIESVSKKISIDDFMEQLRKSRNQDIRREEDTAADDSVVPTRRLSVQQRTLAEQEAEQEELRRMRSTSAPPMRQSNSSLGRRKSVSGVMDAAFEVKGFAEDKVYKKTKNIRKGSMSAIDAKDNSIQKKANLARFINSTMKKVHQKPVEETPQVSATDIILLRAFLDTWEKSNLLKSDKSLSLQEYLEEHKDLHMAVTVPTFNRVNSAATAPFNQTGLPRCYSGMHQVRIPFSSDGSASPKTISPGKPFSPSGVGMKSPLTRPVGLASLSIIIPDDDSPRRHESVPSRDGNNSRSETREAPQKSPSTFAPLGGKMFENISGVGNAGHDSQSLLDRRRSTSSVPTPQSLAKVGGANDSKRATSPARRGSVSIGAMNNLRSEAAPLAKPPPPPPKFVAAEPTNAEYVHPETSHTKGRNISISLTSNLPFSNSSSSSQQVQRQPSPPPPPLKHVNVANTRVKPSGPAGNEPTEPIEDDEILTGVDGFWKTWNQYVSSTGDKKADACPRRRMDAAGAQSSLDHVRELTEKKKEQNRSLMQKDQEYQRLIAKRKMVEKDPVLKIFYSDSGKKKTTAVTPAATLAATRSGTNPLKNAATGTAVVSNRGSVTSNMSKPPASSSGTAKLSASAPIAMQDQDLRAKSKTALNKAVLPPRAHAYPPGVPGKRF